MCSIPTSDLNKEAIRSYDWAENARKDEVKYQLSLAFPFWRGILGPNSVLGASYTQKSWWQLSNSGESSPFRETNYEPQLFPGFATDYEFAGWTLRDVEVGFNHDSNGRSDPTSRSWNRAYTRLMAQNGNMMVEVKPWYVVGSTDDNPDITKYMGYYQLRIGYQLGDAVLSAGPVQLEHRLRRRRSGLKLPDDQTRAYLYAGLQRLRRVAHRLQLQSDPRGCRRDAERYFLRRSNVFALNVEVSLSGAENSACFISGIWG